MASLTSSLTVKLIDDVSKPARSVSQALKDAEKAAKNVAKGLGDTNATDRLTRSLSKLRLSAKDIETVAASWKDYSKSAGLAARSTDWTKTQAADVRRWEHQTIASLREVKREQQRFFREQAAAMRGAGLGPNIVGGMSAIGAPRLEHLRASQRLAAGMSGSSPKSPAAAIGAAEVAAAGGVIGRVSIPHVAAGYSAYKTAEHFIKSGAEYQHEQIALENAGRTKSELAEAEARAREIAEQLPTTTFVDNLKVINETTGAFGSFHHALENLPFMQKTASVLKAAAGDKIHADAGELGNKFARFFELRGTAGDSATFQREAGEMVRAMAFTRGNFNPDEMLNFAQQAGSGLQNYDMRFLGRIAPAIVTELGGDRAGTGASAWRNTILGKARDKKQAEMWSSLGLLDPKEVIDGKNGPIGWKAGAVKGTDIALQDPLRWTEETLLPAMQRAKIDTSNPLEVTKTLNQLFRNENANRFSNIVTQLNSRQRLHKDEANIEQAGDTDTIYKRNIENDPMVAATTVSAAFDKLGTALTKALPIAKGINELADGINILGQFATDPKKWAETTGEKWKRVGNQAATGARSLLDKYLMKPDAFVTNPAKNMMKSERVDARSVVFAKEKADDTLDALKALDTTVSPIVSTTSLDTAITKSHELLSILRQIEGASGRAAESAGARLQSLGQIRRAGYVTGGLQGE